MNDLKTHLRQRFKHDRITLTESERKRAQSLICASVMEFVSLGTEPCGTVAMYVPIRGEVDIMAVFDPLQKQGWRVAFPRVREAGIMTFHAIDDVRALAPGAFGILEPLHEAPMISAKDIQVACVPGLAFTPHGIRLGYGGGFYDRFLPELQKSGVAIGIAFENQLVPSLPMDSHDMPVDFVITEQGVINCHKPRESSS